MSSHHLLAHEIANEFCINWMEKNGRKPKLDAIDIMERKIASFILINNILKKAPYDKTNHVTE